MTTVRMFDRGALRHWIRPVSVCVALLAVPSAAIASWPVLAGWAPVMLPVVWLALVLAVHLWGDAARRVRIAPDGLELRWLGCRQFVPWDDVVRVTSNARVLTITLVRGRPLELYRAARLALLATKPRKLLGSLTWDVENALARHRLASEEPHRLTPALARGPRTADRWVADLRSLGAGDPYRLNDSAPEELLEVVESAADASARVGAAMALRWRGLRDEDRSRIAAVRVRVADAALAAALDTAVDGDERSVERAARRVRTRRVA